MQTLWEGEDIGDKTFNWRRRRHNRSSNRARVCSRGRAKGKRYALGAEGEGAKRQRGYASWVFEKKFYDLPVRTCNRQISTVRVDFFMPRSRRRSAGGPAPPSTRIERPAVLQPSSKARSASDAMSRCRVRAQVCARRSGQGDGLGLCHWKCLAVSV